LADFLLSREFEFLSDLLLVKTPDYPSRLYSRYIFSDALRECSPIDEKDK
jgi:hypothetical protein